MSLEPQLKLTYAPKEEEDSQLNLFSATQQTYVIPEHELDFLIQMDPEVAIWRRRTMLMASVFIHILLIILLAFSPELLRRGRIMMGIPVEPKKDQQVTTLFLPPDLLKSLRQPPPEAKLSDKNRQAQGRSPIIDPKGVHMPYAKGNTPLPEVRQGPPPAPTPAQPAAPAPQQSAPPQQQPPPPRHEPPAEAQLHMEDVRPPSQSNADMFRRSMTPGQAIQQSLQEAARGGYHPESGAGAGGDSNSAFDNLHPNFSTEQPTVLSDMRGVDFGPYLARIVMLVKRNWISILPESARLGEKGRVGVVFEILKNGEMPQERMVASSGSDPLDRAAFSSIHASAPFPPLPTEFTGDNLILQFTFLYNEQPR